MNREDIKDLALYCGFKLEQQPDGSEDLNPCVYEFAFKLAYGVQMELHKVLEYQSRYRNSAPDFAYGFNTAMDIVRDANVIKEV